ncbi:MAG: hypothetical protein H7Y06_00455, partial [Opitutaceae bacterium]|nr:hypothetical protein [Opitutaceae bacterium]
SYGVAEGGFYNAEPNGLKAGVTTGAHSTDSTYNGLYSLARGTFPATATGSNYSADVRFVPFTPLQAWCADYFTSTELNNPALESTVWGNLADPDADGVSNLLEYALGGDPLVTSGTDIPVCALNSDTPPKLTLTFLRARADLTYLVQASSDLAIWTDLATNPGAVSPTVPVTVTDTPPPDAAKRFVRLRITGP